MQVSVAWCLEDVEEEEEEDQNNNTRIWLSEDVGKDSIA